MKRISSNDVAREAGVSRATVSYILNNKEGIKIKPETREKVLEAAEKIGYQPNSIARAMKTKKSMCIGVVSKRRISEIRLIYVLEGIKEVLDAHGYSILLSSHQIMDNGKPEFYNHFFQGKIDGVIIISEMEGVNKGNIEKIAQEIRNSNIPAVLVDYHLNNSGFCCVDIDYYGSGYSAAEHVINKGYKKITYLDPSTDSIQEIERKNGVIAAAKHYGFDNENIQFVNMGTNDKSWSCKAEELLQQNREKTVIIAAWTSMAFCLLNSAHINGIKIPQKLGIIALGVGTFVNYTYPALSTMDLPLYEAGKKSAEFLLKQIEENMLCKNVKLSCRLIDNCSV